jgi:hypothetical protein
MESNVKKSRKQRRYEAKLARRGVSTDRPTVLSAIRSMISTMKESKRVQELVASGSLDKYLK